MKKLLVLSITVFCAISSFAQDLAAQLTDKLYNSKDYVFVVAHRGDWRFAPENSLPAFQHCIDEGVDMVELDLQMTSDSVLVLMHDHALDRTSTGNGRVSNFTYEEIKKLRLRDGLRSETDVHIPTLSEALDLCKDKILINIDKGYDYFSQVYDLLVEKDMLDQVIIKSGNSLKTVQQDHQDILDKVIYMPVISLDREGAEKMVDDFIGIHVAAIECCFGTVTPQVEYLLEKIRQSGVKIWINSLWPNLNGGHHDDRAVLGHDPDGSWGWLLEKGAMLIQTDRNPQLIQYLESKGLRK